jgi:hypothetical protein
MINECKRLEGIYSVGASVAINCEPKVLALVYAGEIGMINIPSHG